MSNLSIARIECGPAVRRARQQAVALLLMLMLFALGVREAQAGPRTTNLNNIIPTVTSLTLTGNPSSPLLASGTATALIKGTTVTVPFTAPANLSLAANQAGAAPGCPILDLTLGPINLNLLGLVVQTSPICLTITAYQGGGLLGTLLCDVANLLNGGISLTDILSGLTGLTSSQLSTLNTTLISLLNGGLQQLLNAVLQSIDIVNQGHTCSILNLALGPVDLTLLGLNVHLDNCSNGPVTVTITAVTGQGNLLGNLLCELVDGGLLNLGATLQQILNALTGLLTA